MRVKRKFIQIEVKVWERGCSLEFEEEKEGEEVSVAAEDQAAYVICQIQGVEKGIHCLVILLFPGRLLQVFSSKASRRGAL